MTDDAAPLAPKPPAPSRRRKPLMILAALCFATLGVAYGAYWFSIARFEVSTDDAYVSGNVVQVSPQITGTVIAVHADDTDFVRAGQSLVDIDPTDAALALDQAKAHLAETVREVRALYRNDDALAAAVSQQETNLTRLQDDLERRRKLAETGAVSSEELKHARAAVQQATAQLANIREQLEANRALVANTTPTTHPRVSLAAAQLREAYLAWRRTVVPAPVSGQVARRDVQVGQRVTPGAPLMAVVPLDQVWVDANFKEGQLRDMRIGQPASLTADTYGGSVVYHGKVVGLAAGTGAAFSLLPAQNATGNWIKVVQRVPVRIALDPAELKVHPLRIGMSMDVDVTVSDRGGPRLSTGRRQDTVAQTTVFQDLDKQADRLIDSLIAQSREGSRVGSSAGDTEAATTN